MRENRRMLHTPVNHHLRPLYRTLAGLAGVYVLLFGIIGLVQTRGLDFFAQHDLPWVLGLRTNPAFSILSIGAGLVMLVLQRTDANFLGFSVSNCVASFILGIITGTAGLYGKVGSVETESAEESFRHGSAAASQ